MDIEPNWSTRGVEKTQEFSKGRKFESPQYSQEDFKEAFKGTVAREITSSQYNKYANSIVNQL
jgi:hypothetical protein